MPPTRILKAESFRFAALFALAFLALTAVLFGMVLWIVDGNERSTLVAADESDIATITNGLHSEGINEAIEVVNQTLGVPREALAHRRHFGPETFMVIEDASGVVLAGNLPFVPCRPGNLTIQQPPIPGVRHSRVILGRCAPLTPAVMTFVGRDTFAMHETREHIMEAFGWVAMGTCILSLIAGLLLGQRFMARVDAITQTCERVIAGNFNERIPVRRRDDEWDRLARAINEMLDRISALLDNLQQVSSDVAHDLRTPLTRLRNRLEAARERPPAAGNYPAVIADALGDTDQILSMFSALLRISQIEAGTRMERFTTVDLSGVLEQLYQIYLPVAEDAGHVLTCELHVSILVRGDTELLTQLFSNLIENAIRHTPRGSAIRMHLTGTNEEAAATVTDNGPGVPAQDHDKVTQRFYRGSSSRSSEGHGLGLALVMAIAQLHGAKLVLSDASPGLRVDILFRRLASA